MEGILSTTDFVVFFGSLLAVMAVGLWAGRSSGDSAQSYFLADKDIPWWGVAGSVFGTNVSANHMVGFMAIGFTLGFVESQFEITAIAGLLMLCYFFLPMYRKLHVYTLSDYLARRFDDRSRLAYSLIMLIIIVLIMILPAFYVGSRAVNILLADPGQMQAAVEAGQSIQIKHGYYIAGVLIMALVAGGYTVIGGLRAVIITDAIQSVFILLGMLIVAWCTFNHDLIGGWATMVKFDEGRELDKVVAGKDMLHLYLPSDHPQRPWTGMLTGLMVLHFYYWGANQFVVQRALAARSLKDARAGIITAGFFKLLIPFVSIGTGIAAYYLFKQTMPGVTLDGDTAFPMLLREVVAPLAVPGLVGLVAAGLIGAILSSVDSMLNSASTLITFDLYKKHINPKADDEQLVRMGRWLIVAMVVGAALLTILVFDPNSKEPFFTYVAKHQSRLVAGVVAAFLLGMLWRGATAAGGFASIVTGVVVAYALPPLYVAVWSDNPEIVRFFGYELNFFHSVFVAFIFALLANVAISGLARVTDFQRKIGTIGVAAVLAVFCIFLYSAAMTDWKGGHHFLMSGPILCLICGLCGAGFYRLFVWNNEPNEEKGRMTWTGLNLVKSADLQHFGMKLLGSLLVFAMLGVLMTGRLISPMAAGMAAAVWTFLMFMDSLFKVVLTAAAKGRAYSLLREDRFWAGLLAASAVFMMYYFK